MSLLPFDFTVKFGVSLQAERCRHHHCTVALQACMHTTLYGVTLTFGGHKTWISPTTWL